MNIRKLNEEIEKVLNEGIRDDINYFFNKRNMALDDKIDYLFNKYVPAEGKAKTVGGEIIRALCRVVYRWMNDGDMLFKDYGIETCAPSAVYLMQNCNETISNIIQDLSETDYEDYYTKGLEKLKQEVLKFLDENSKLFKQSNSKDSLETNVDSYDTICYYEVTFDDAYLSGDKGYESLEDAIEYAKHAIESEYEVVDIREDENYINNPSTGSEVAWVTAEVLESDYDDEDDEDDHSDGSTKEVTGSITVSEVRLSLR